MSQYIGSTINELPSPAVLIEQEVLHRNIDEMAAHANRLGVALRPHWKTSKTNEVAKLQLAAGAIGHTVATAEEALALAGAGHPDIFWAYPPVGPHRVQTAIEVAKRTRLIVGPDSIESLRPLATSAAAAGIEIDVRLEIDTGVRRTGVHPDQAVQVALEMSALAGVRFEGVFMHEGHVQGVGADPELRQRTGEAAARLLVETAEAIRAAGVEVESVSVGSTAGVRSAPLIRGVTEARPGTYVYGDENQVSIGTVAPEDAAMTVLSRVISVERAQPVLIDAGIKAMSSDGSMHGDGRIGTVVSASGGIVAMGHEEHGFLHGSEGLSVGDVIRIRPNHACGLSNMHSRVFLVHNEVVVAEWPVLGRH